jgi:hypothetical protein
MSDPSIAIFECLYASGANLSDPLLSPLRIRNDHPHWRELQAYLEIHRLGLWRDQAFTGMFSPKFTLKTHVGVDEFRRFVSDHADADVCLINPFPQIAYWSYNVWMQGEHAHPGLAKASQELLDAVGIPWNLSKMPRHGHDLLAYGNFWVARPEFWESFVGELLTPIADFLLANPSHAAVQGILQTTNHTNAAPFLPFMIERLFSSYLSLNPKWRVAAFPVAQDVQKYCLNDFESLLFQQLRHEVDAADAEGRFTPSLIARMDDQCALFQQHTFDYYAHRTHPHSGSTMSRIDRC